jgi:hypothetical protein
MKRALLALLSLTLIFVGCGKKEVVVKKTGAVCQAPSEVPLDRAYAALETCYRLKPDRRLLLALAEIHRFFSGKEVGEAECVFDNGSWHVYCGDEEAGTLSEYPGFPEMKKLLLDWTARVSGDHRLKLKKGTADATAMKAIRENIGRFYSSYLLEALQKIDAQWNQGEHDPELLAEGARASVLLCRQVFDRLDGSDSLKAKALALWAVAKGLTQANLDREEALLAEAFEFLPHAAKLAALLPGQDPLRPWLAGEYDRIIERYPVETGSAEQRFFCLQSIARNKDAGKWREFSAALTRDAGLRLPVLKTGLELIDFDLYAALPPQVIFQVMKESLRNPPRDKESLASVVQRFESEWPRLAGNYPGPFLRFGEADSFYRSYFYSALWAMAIHFLENLHSYEGAAEFLGQLPGMQSGQAADFRRWLSDILAARTGAGNPSRLLAGITEIRTFNGGALYQTYRQFCDRLPYADPRALQAARDYLSRLDQRARQQNIMRVIATKELQDLRLREKLILGISDAFGANDFNNEIDKALLESDRPAIVRVLADRRYDPELKVDYLEEFSKIKMLSAADAAALYAKLMQDFPDRSLLIHAVGRHFEHSGDFRTGEKLFAAWLQDHPDMGGFEEIAARAGLAKMYYGLKRFREAYAIVSPVAESGQATAMETTARVLAKLGRLQEAEALAASAVGRYPDSMRTRLVLCALYWQQRKNQEAALVLKSFPGPFPARAWTDDIAPLFVALFQDKPAEAMAAVKAILASGMIATDIGFLAREFAAGGNHRLAFGLMGIVPASGQQAIDNVVRAYSYLKRFQGPEQARAWLKGKIAAGAWRDAGMIFYDAGEYDLLWENEAGAGPPAAEEYNWLLRAAAWVQTGRKEDARRDMLLAFYRQPGRIYYHQAGACLMGLFPEKDAAALAKSPKQKCEIAYFLGLKAEGDGRLADASCWYRVCLETMLDRNAEYRWAGRALGEWQVEGKSLARLAADRQAIKK